MAAGRTADVVIAGSCGHSRIKEWVLGGVTRTLLKYPVCFSLVFRRRAEIPLSRPRRYFPMLSGGARSGSDAGGQREISREHKGRTLKEVEVTVTFRPVHSDWTTLSRTSRGTIEALYQHPMSHNLEWSGVVALFEKLGTVDYKAHNEIAFGISGEHHRVRRPHSKDLTAPEVLTFRHMLTRAGWAPASPAAKTGAAKAGTPAANTVEAFDLLVVVDHHEARLYVLDVRSADPVDHVIRPHDPYHRLHHVSHNDQAREKFQRTPEDNAFDQSIAQALMLARSIVVIGHGTGRSNAAHQLIGFLHQRHPDTANKVMREVVADLSSLTAPQLLNLGRYALTAGAPVSASESPNP